MSIHRDAVVYADPTNERDVLSAEPSRNDGACYGTISVTEGADFGNGFWDDRGTTQSVCVKPGEELSVLAALGDQLRDVHADQPDNKTVVGTVATLKAFADSLGLNDDQTGYLIGLFTMAPAKDDQLV